MSDLAVQVDNLSKRYHIGAKRENYGTLRDTLTEAFTKFRNPKSEIHNLVSFWALRDVSFEVKGGELLGIIGRNGAGKSTLLKILSRVTRPTVGRAVIRGRVGSLLEVGTGFHPELTGRENIYLNGAVLGMKKTEIQHKFDEIVEFAEIEQFLDTPVKRYSSGMYMRLAFAIAAHLEPEILVVDEVLAVGDVAFRKKCVGKMREVSSREGRTILFVSHDMEAIQRLCSRCMLLQQGQVLLDGDPASVIAQYLAVNSSKGCPNTWIDLSHASRVGTGEAQFTAVQFTSDCAAVAFQPYCKGPVEFLLAIESDSARSVGSLAVSLCDLSGLRLINADTVLMDRRISLRKGYNVVRLSIDSLYLNSGVYRLGLWLADPITAHTVNSAYDYVESAFEVEVVKLESDGNGLSPNSIVTCEFDVIEVSSSANSPSQPCKI